jgi:antitoxin component of RelBE/YafQ-DinJ toxin-antitoxin module
MTEERTRQRGPESRRSKSAAEVCSSADAPMTDAQRSYLRSLSEEARVPFDDTLTREQASKRIDELQGITGRGLAQEDPERQRVEAEEVESKK